MNIGDGRSEGLPEGSDLSLGDRYTIVRPLDSQNDAQGGRSASQQSGKTYLVKDKEQAGELCIAKSFLSSVQDASTLEEAKFLFEQEADLLYQLDHPQLPKFRQLLEVPVLSGAGGQLLLVQDYVIGLTYQDILQNRQQIGGRFHEAEINQLLHQLLPVLSYIHSKGLVHRDIRPENIVHRQTDMLPVLIDFGSVKALTASVRSRLGIEGVISIGKAGYTPPDQIGESSVDQTSDLYGLAATMLTLATGESPQPLYSREGGNGEKTWRGIETLSPKLGDVLLKMLSAEAEDRFPTADAVIEALNSEEATVPDGISDQQEGVVPDEMTAFHEVGDNPMYDGAVPVGLAGGMGAAAGAIAAGVTGPKGYEDAERFSPEGYGQESYSPEENYDPDSYSAAVPFEEGPIDPSAPMAPVIPMTTSIDSAANESATYEPDINERRDNPEKTGNPLALLGLLGVLGVAGLLLMLAIPRLNGSPLASSVRRAEIPQGDANQNQNQNQNQIRAIADGEYVAEEVVRKQEITLRREDLGMGDTAFTSVVNQLFYQAYPQLLTAGPNGGQRTLSDAGADEPIRIRWDHIAADLLGRLESDFSAQSLRSVGSYGAESQEQWRSRIAETAVPERALTDLADAKFFRLFPDQSGRDFTAQPVGQLYWAIADDTARAIESGSVTEPIRFSAGAFSQDARGQLTPGAGRIYTLALTNGQLLRLNLSTPNESTLLSLYSPTSTADGSAIFSDSEQTTWSGAVSETGTYSVVVVNRGGETIDYTLSASVDNVTSAPVPAEVEESVEPENEGEGQVDLSEPPVAPPRDDVGDSEVAE